MGLDQEVHHLLNDVLGNRGHRPKTGDPDAARTVAIQDLERPHGASVGLGKAIGVAEEPLGCQL